MEASLPSIIDKINDLFGKVKSLSVNQKWDRNFIEQVKLDFTYNSNKLEGNSLTYGETISFLKNITIPHKGRKDLLDIENHHKVLDKVFDQYDKPFSVEFIKQIHKELMKDYDQWDFDSLPNPGQFKLFENYAIRPTGEIKEYMKPSKVEAALNTLVDNTNMMISQADINIIQRHPITIATAFHNEFLNTIHPFQDGNGRIGRIFSNLVLLKTDFPPIFIDTNDNVEREKYLNKIHESEKQNNLVPMIKYCGERLIESLERKYSYIKQSNLTQQRDNNNGRGL